MFEFNAYSAPLLPGFLQGLIFAVILLLRGFREERVSDYFAALLLVMGSLYVGQWMFGFANWYDAHDWRTTLMFYVEWKNLLAFGPLIWLYFRSLTNTNFRWQPKYWWHFLPLGLVLTQPLAIFIYDWVYWWLIKGETFTYFFNTRGPASEWDNNSNSPVFLVVYTISILHLLTYLVWTLMDYRKYRTYLEREFSNAEQLTFKSLRLTLYLMLAGVLLTIFLDIHNLMYSTSYIDSWDSFFAMSIFTYLMAIQLLAINPRLTRALRFVPEAEVQQPVALPAEAKKAATELDPELRNWAEKLEERFAVHQDYLNPDLKLGDLAESIRTNSSVLSKVINSVYGMNFNDFINSRRCEAFLRAVQAGEHRQHTLLSIALDCGFNSKSTFNRAFKKHTGKSPGSVIRDLT
ncbi:MAG: helix-turn-helix transcriptional regulator [Bacteroidota bacterium]